MRNNYFSRVYLSVFNIHQDGERVTLAGDEIAFTAVYTPGHHLHWPLLNALKSLTLRGKYFSLACVSLLCQRGVRNAVVSIQQEYIPVLTSRFTDIKVS